MSANGGQQALARQEPPKPMVVFARALDALGPKVTRASGGKVDPKRLGQLVMFAVQRSESLVAAVLTPRGRQSILDATIDAAALGLMPTGKYGGGYLIPFNRTDKHTGETWTDVVFVPDYRALARQIERGFGPGWRVRAEIVCENDIYTVRPGGTHPVLDHDYEVNGTPETRGSMVGAYAIAFPPNEGERPIWRYLSAWEITTKHEARSRGASKPDSPWVTDRDTMFKKTALRVFASESLDAQGDVQRFLAAADRETEHGDTPEAVALAGGPERVLDAEVVDAAPAPTRTAALAAKLGGTPAAATAAATSAPAPGPAAASTPPEDGPPSASPPPSSGQGDLALPVGSDAGAPKPRPEPDPRRDTHPDWPAPTCVECGPAGKVARPLKASKYGDWECSGPQHPDALRFFRATDADFAKVAEIRGALGAEDNELLDEALSDAGLPADKRQWTTGHAAKASMLAQEAVSSRPRTGPPQGEPPHPAEG